MRRRPTGLPKIKRPKNIKIKGITKTMAMESAMGMNSTEAGELWFATERLAVISPSMSEPARLKKLDLSRYTQL